MATKTGFADVNGAKLYYEVAGDGPPLVFVHGYALDRRMWDDQFEFFATRFRVLRYDLRGFGRSAVPTEALFSNHDDLRRLLDFLGIEQAHICGLSMGGGVTIDFALEYPDRVLSVIVIASAVGGVDVDYGPMVPAIMAMHTAARDGDLVEAKRIWTESPLFVPANRDAAVARRLREMVDDWSGWQMTNQSNHVDPDPPSAGRLDQLAVPALVINGALDNEGVLGVAAEIEARAPHARRVVVPDVGHLANMEAPEAVKDLITTFLEPCFFCRSVLAGRDRPLLAESPHVVAFEDNFGSAPGHTLVIPRRHVGRVLDLTDAEYTDLFSVARAQLRRLEAAEPDAYTIGVNDGPAAGQSVPHVHLHLIPRRHGDTANPRGGIRWAIPETAAYWEGRRNR